MSIAELRQLPVLEKVRIVEALWADLSSDETVIDSPEWHATELKKTEADYQSGKIKSIDWDEAKKSLRARFE